MNYQTIYYTSDGGDIIDVEYTDTEPTEKEVAELGIRLGSPFAECYQDIDEDGTYGRFLFNQTINLP